MVKLGIEIYGRDALAFSSSASGFSSGSRLGPAKEISVGKKFFPISRNVLSWSYYYMSFLPLRPVY